MFFILWRNRGHGRAEGWLFGLYAVLAGAERLAIEFLRAKPDRLVIGLTVAQVVAIGFVVAGLGLMAWRRRVTVSAPGIYAS